MEVNRAYQKLTTVEQSIKSNSPSLGSIVNACGTKPVEGYLKLWLIELNTIVNIKRPLNELQMEFIAMRIVGKYRNLKISDIYLIFTAAKSGEYGELYERLSPDKVLKWFDDYYENRIEVAANMSRDLHAQNKESSAREGNIMREMNKKLSGMAGNLSEIKKNQKKK